MSRTNIPEATKNPKQNKDAVKSPQELYDNSIQKGDEAIIAEDIILAEKYYQHADYFLRCMNNPQHWGNAPSMQHSAHSLPMEDLIGKALEGIAAVRVARKEAFLDKVGDAAKTVKAARPEKKDKARKSKAARQKQTIQVKKVDKKPKNRGEPCKVILLNSQLPCAGVEQQT